jgi:hypothetical protein
MVPSESDPFLTRMRAAMNARIESRNNCYFQPFASPYTEDRDAISWNPSANRTGRAAYASPQLGTRG